MNAKKTTPEQAQATTPAQAETFAITSINPDVFSVKAQGTGEPIRHTTTTEMTTLFNAVNGSGIPIKDIIGDTIEVNDIVVTSVDVKEDINDDDSPLVNKACANFFTTDGNHYSSISNGIIRAVKNLLNCGLTPTPETPVRIKFKTVNTKRGVAHTFDLVK